MPLEGDVHQKVRLEDKDQDEIRVVVLHVVEVQAAHFLSDNLVLPQLDVPVGLQLHVQLLQPVDDDDVAVRGNVLSGSEKIRD